MFSEGGKFYIGNMYENNSYACSFKLCPKPFSREGKPPAPPPLNYGADLLIALCSSG